MPAKMPASPVGVHKFNAWLWLLARADSGRQQAMVQVSESLSSTCETWIEFLAPRFRPSPIQIQPWLFKAFEKSTSRWEFHFSRSLAHQLSHSPFSSPSLPPSTSHMGKTKKCSKVSRCHKRRIQAFHDQKLNLGLSVAQISRKKCFRTPTDAATPSLKEVS